jgi:hypothetical protein
VVKDYIPQVTFALLVNSGQNRLFNIIKGSKSQEAQLASLHR